MIRHWQVTARIYWNKIRFGTISFVIKSPQKLTQITAKHLCVKYWKRNWQRHNHNDSYYTMPEKFVKVQETRFGASPEAVFLD